MLLLQAFTWQSFLIAALILSVLWYLGVGLLYGRSSGAGLFSAKPKGSYEPLAHGWADGVDELSDGLMGKPVNESGVSVLEADEFSFAPAEPAAVAADLLGDLADVQQEIKSICQILEKEDGSKEDFFALFEVIRSKYPRVASSGLVAELNEFIREHVPFHLSEAELEGLWL